MADVPEIDVSALVRTSAEDPGTVDAGWAAPDVAAAAAAIDAACREVGFFTIVGHGVDPDLILALHDASRRFFALPETAKAEVEMTNGGRAWRGWFPVGGELTSGVPDHKEGLYVGSELGPDDPRVVARTPLHGPNLFPTTPADLGPVVLGYLDELTRVGQAVLAGMAIGLGLEPRWFARHLTTDPVILFRIFHYPPGGPDTWGVGEHTDYGLLTLLGQDGTPGLEVRGRDGWTTVDARADRFVCNIGDMLERLTGGHYRSTPHRVRADAAVGRLSFPFFLDPAWDAVVDRLPIVDRPTDDGAAERWDRTSVHGFTGTYGDYLMGKVAKVFPDLVAATVSAPDERAAPPTNAPDGSPVA